MLKPGEAAVLFIRRSETSPDLYYVAVRRSEMSFFDEQNDFQIGPFQFPVTEWKDVSDYEAALMKGTEMLRAMGRKVAAEDAAPDPRG